MSDPRHAVNDEGDCLDWCEQCRRERNERDSLKAQLADAEKVMEAARALVHSANPDDMRSIGAAMDRGVASLAAYDAKWRAGK